VVIYTESVKHQVYGLSKLNRFGLSVTLSESENCAESESEVRFFIIGADRLLTSIYRVFKHLPI